MARSLLMSCKHLFFPMCGCPVDAAPVPADEPAVAPVASAPVVPEVPKKKSSGRPKTPWGAERGIDTRKERSTQAMIRKAQEQKAAAQPEQIARAIELAMTDRAEFERQLAVAFGFGNFAKFCQLVWHVVEPATKLQWNWHHELIANTLQALFEDWKKATDDETYINAVRNAALNTCPGSLKSRITSVFFPVWCWLHRPGMKFICLSVNEDAAMRDARAARDLIRSDFFQTSFHPKWTLKGDQDAISNYGNTEGGERLSKPSGSQVVGLRADCVAGETLVATELGDMRIDALHEMHERGEEVPRVWTMNHETNNLELHNILGTRCIPQREIVEVITEADNLLRCTDDHRIHTEEKGYEQAASIARSTVSVLRSAVVSVSEQDSTALSRVSLRNLNVHTLHDGVRTPRSRVRQTGSARCYGRSILQQELQDDLYAAQSHHAALLDLRQGVQNQGQVSSLLLERVRRKTHEPSYANVGVSSVPAVQRDLSADRDEGDVLQPRLRELCAFDSHDRFRELSLQRQHQPVRRIVDVTGDANSRARRQPMHGMREERRGESARTARTSHRRESAEQRPREPDNVLRRVSYDVSQTHRSTVLSVSTPFEGGSRTKVNVYDLHIDGCHNFFANGILVHNCILYDDPNDPHEAENAAEREKLNSLFETNIYNRVNDPLRSLRIGIQQRVHSNDWTGFVITKQGLWSPANPDGWLHLVLPVEFDPERKFMLPASLVSRLRELLGDSAKIVVEDQRITAGMSVHPERFSADYLTAERKRWEGTASFSAQMNQAPINKKGGQIRREWFNFFRLEGGVRANVDALGGGHPRPPECHGGDAYLVQAARHRPGQWQFDWVVISIDAALQKTDRGSNWGLGVMAGQGGRRFVLDDRTQRGDILEIIQVLRDMIRTWPVDKILIEKKAAGESLRVMLQAEMAKGDLPPIQIEVVDPGNQGKEQRLDPCKPALSAGMLHLLDGAPWLDAFVSELAAFPFGTRDDRTDLVSMCMNHFAPADAESNSLPEW